MSRIWAVSPLEKPSPGLAAHFRAGLLAQPLTGVFQLPIRLVAALRGGILTVPEAEAIRQELAQHRFLMPDLPPFEELLHEEE